MNGRVSVWLSEGVTTRRAIGCLLLLLLPFGGLAAAGFVFFCLLPALHPTPHPKHLRPLWTLKTNYKRPGCLAYAPGQNTFIFKTNQGIEFHDAATGKLVARIRCVGDLVQVSKDGKLLAESSGRTVKLWSVASHRVVRTFKPADKVHSAALSPDGQWLATLDAERKLTLWRTTASLPILTLDARKQGSHFQAVAFSPDGKTLAVETGNSYTYIYAIPSGKLEHTLDCGDGGPPTDDNLFVAYSPDGRFLVTVGTGDHDVETSTHVWSASDWRQVAHMEDVGIDSAAFAPDSSRLVTGSGATDIWDAATWQNTYTLDPAAEKEKEADIGPVTFGKNNRIVASEDDSGSVRAWALPPVQHSNHTTVNVRRRG